MAVNTWVFQNIGRDHQTSSINRTMGGSTQLDIKDSISLLFKMSAAGALMPAQEYAVCLCTGDALDKRSQNEQQQVREAPSVVVRRFTTRFLLKRRGCEVDLVLISPCACFDNSMCLF